MLSFFQFLHKCIILHETRNTEIDMCIIILVFDEDDLSAQPGQVAKVSSVDSVECVIVHLTEDFKGDPRVGWS